MKKLLFVISLCTLVAAFIVTRELLKLHKATMSKDAIVRLVEDGRTFCSGVVVADNVILTALHCVQNPAPIEIRRNDNLVLKIYGKPFTGRPQLDQAALIGDFRKLRHADFVADIKDLSDLRTNKNFRSCGYPLGGELYCSDLVYRDVYGFNWSMKGLLLPGMSGGATFDSYGRVVAINSAVSDNFSLVTPLYNIFTLFR